VSVTVKVLEKALGIESVLSDNLSEALNDVLNDVSLVLLGLLSAVDGLGANSIERLVNLLLEALLGEDLIDSVAEVPPSDMLALLGSLECLTEKLELRGRNRALGHVKADSELARGDVARSELVEVSEELSNSDSLLGAKGTDAGENVIHIIRVVSDNLSTAGTSLSLGEVREGVVEVSANTIKLVRAVNILAEVDIVDLIDVAFVHVATEHKLGDLLGSVDLEEVEHSQELSLGHVTVLGDIEVLEQGLQQDASGVHGEAVLVEDLLNVVGSSLLLLEVLSAGEQGVLLGDGLDLDGRGLVNSLDSEGKVDVVAEGVVVEELLGIVGAVLGGKSLELIISQGEVHR